ncbi:hypothetical protein HD_1364 [[Haemophilus] ducreyi 35000HP]|uniref:Uncharacterized protein n=1 Tax=Haemophilus ducreyi (strain 35000HP / ATCC 700724) TaxID=233412 RepID=Q7VLQ8_HAEDU|nr:hypothetical protein HD_1364 [[Haemophilus] ducreyi 35000HP]
MLNNFELKLLVIRVKVNSLGSKWLVCKKASYFFIACLLGLFG